MHSDIHDQIEDDPQRRNPGEIEESGEKNAQNYRVNESVFLDAARHAEMAMSDHGSR